VAELSKIKHKYIAT